MAVVNRGRFNACILLTVAFIKKAQRRSSRTLASVIVGIPTLGIERKFR
jgi:hypothetical protein